MVFNLDKEHLLESITRAQNSFIAEQNTHRIFDQLLVSLLKLTNSEYGYIGEVVIKNDGTRFLRTHAISNIAWNDETRAFYEEKAPTGLEFYNLKSLFGHVIAHEEVVIANDPANDPRACGLPPGHPDLNAFLGLPFFARGQLVGSAGISNRPGGYSQDVVEFLQPFVATCANIILADRDRQSSERTEKLKREFISVISHELRTPMTAIHGSLGLLKFMCDENAPAEAKNLLNIAHDGSERMIRLLNDILDVEKLESGTLQLKMGECDLKKVMSGCIDELRSEAEKKKNVLVVECKQSVKIRADADRMAQIFINLLSNAIKFTENGTITLQCQDKGDILEISITDTGRGIPEGELEQIFDKFHQVAEANTRGEGGIGLGLYIVTSLVKQHGGSVSVTSELGKGTTFTLYFPRDWSVSTD